MKQLQFEDYEELACDISDTFYNIEDEYGEVSIIAKYDEANKIIKELIYIGYDIASLELHREEFENYFDEYIISLNFDGVWCEKFKKRDTGYFNDESNVIYIMDNCSSVVIPYCNSENLYEVSVDDSIERSEEYSYMANGDFVDKNEDTSDSDDCSISLKLNLDAHEALEVIRDMEHRMMHMNNMLCKTDYFRRLFNW